MASPKYCRQSSLEVGEGLAGTAAADTDRWIILEVPEAWAAQPLDSPVLAQSRATLESWSAAVPRSRLQLVRRPRSEDGERTLFLASSSPGDSWIAAITKRSHGELMALDVPQLFSNHGGPESTPVSALYLVCTHGRRDACCAKWGMGLFNAAHALEPSMVWQTSHLGGHRFAATALSLPNGICYGRMTEGDAEPWLAAEARGELFDLARVRGRTALSKAAQAAELAAHEQLGALAMQGIAATSCTELEPGSWLVAVEVPGSPSIEVEVQAVVGGSPAFGSCSDDEPRVPTGLRCSIRR